MIDTKIKNKLIRTSYFYPTIILSYFIIIIFVCTCTDMYEFVTDQHGRDYF
jgi:hypothetical protein